MTFISYIASKNENILTLIGGAVWCVLVHYALFGVN